MTPAAGLSPAGRRILAYLARGPAVLETRPAPVLRRIGADRLERLAVDPAILESLTAAGLAARLAGSGEFALTAMGRDRADPDAETRMPERPAERAVARRLDPLDSSAPVLLVDDGESPLAWLHRRRGRDGAPLVGDVEFAAGERLRRDFTRAGLMPGLTSNWRSDAPTGGGARGGPADLADSALAARDRVGRAVSAVGPDLGGLLVDVCCFLKGLEVVEAERRWPARSAKVVLRIALSRLADHYGMAAAAAGPDRSRGLGHWGTDDYRPTVMPG
jgi:hypothetical protein